MEWVAIVQQLNRDLLAIEMTRSALLHQKLAIRSVPLVDDETHLPVSKVEFKELGSAEIIVEQVGVEALIGLMANAIETFALRMNRHLGIVWEPFKSARNDIRFANRIRQFRALNNVFKHQEGYIETASSMSARFLVDEGFFPDQTYLKHLPAENIVPGLELSIFEAFAHLYEMTYNFVHLPNCFANKCGAELVRALRDVAVYPIIMPTLLREES